MALTTEQLQGLYERCVAAHLRDLHSGSSGYLHGDARKLLDYCLEHGQRQLWIKARIEAGKQHSADVIARNDELYRKDHS